MVVGRAIRLARLMAGELTAGEGDPWLVGILVTSAALCVYHLNWGLPNGNLSWASDALGPLSVLNIAKRTMGTWNSGWFWYKYPFGYPLVLLLAYLPCLAALVVTGQLRHPRTTYPYGFAHPEAALYVLALIGRCVNVAMIVATVALTYGIARRLLGSTAARFAAFFAATAYPLVYYAHTTNQDAAYMFWLTAAVWATVVAAHGEQRWPYVLLGITAAMAMATKEQGFGLLLALPLIIAVLRQRAQPATWSPAQRWWAAVWNPSTRAGLCAAVATGVIATNALVNPRGVANRFWDLTGHPIPGLSARITPLKFALFKGLDKEWWYLRQLADVVESTFGFPLLLVAVAGVVYLAWSQRRAAFCLLVPAGAYYFFSLRTHDVLTLRYTLPLVPLIAASAGALCTALCRYRRGPAAVLLTVLCGLALARAVELDVLLRGDSRYQAERWFAAHAAAGSSVEFYQKPAYVPRWHRLDARSIPLDERTIAGVRARHPDFIVISSAGKKGVTHFWNPDWHKGGLLLERPEARAFLNALEAGELPYRRVADFTQRPHLLRLRITSLCPEISIFQRVPPS